MKSRLACLAAAGAAIVVACADHPPLDFVGDDPASETPAARPAEEAQDSSTPLPGPSDGGNETGNDAANDAANDAGDDAGMTPEPGDLCSTADEITSRSCGQCGEQKAICQDLNGKLAWSGYGQCTDEKGACMPGDTRACGDCGTETCTNTCGWGPCMNQPMNHCAPGTLERTNAGCPAGGFRKRTCEATCQWALYSPACTAATAADLFAGAATHSVYMRATDGTLYGWGRDQLGQLGDGETGASANKDTISPVWSLTDVVSLQGGGGTGSGFACASFADGSAKCWGNNGTFGLGDGSGSSSLTGVTPTGFGADVVSMHAGLQHGCGLFADGSAKCWGYNTSGQLGNGTTANSTTPVVVGLTGISKLYTGQTHTCALKDGAAYCWGANGNGQVGDKTTTNRSTPTLVIDAGVVALAPSNTHTCALMTDGTVKCWGQNTSGQVGNGSGGAGNAPNVTSPAIVVGIDGVGSALSDVAEVCTGAWLSCARLTDGRVACWGINNLGQLGIGGAPPPVSNVPKVVTGVAGATKLVCGVQHVCVIDAANKVKCWGDNQYGQIGNGAMPVIATTAQFSAF
ncbi:BNR repeat domain protein [Labilithrix luteola]|uniref:BNR repeat domain protein n=1 Tax=Labilithrix luteola TaxID=1391654 RepID=A0A0K1Q3A2_9BACT|nr:hypothetical protein [Labilithrix luteola]AKV00203.1 BNR repeat domain protein [Labilithrix luteola]